MWLGRSGLDWQLEEMVCTLDYHWHRYVVAALISLFGGVVILLPIRIAWFERRRRRQRGTTASRLQSTLGRLRADAEGILSGNSTINKIIVSLVVFYSSSSSSSSSSSFFVINNCGLSEFWRLLMPRHSYVRGGIIEWWPVSVCPSVCLSRAST